MTDFKLAQKLVAPTPVQDNGNKDGTTVNELIGTDAAQPEQPETKPPIRDSIITGTEMRASAFQDDLLPFDPPVEEE